MTVTCARVSAIEELHQDGIVLSIEKHSHTLSTVLPD